MAELSISKAWEDGSRLAAREFGLLYPIALLLIELPVLACFLILPWTPPADLPPGQTLTFNSVVELSGGLPNILLLTGLNIVVFAVQTFGGLTITWLALRPGSKVGDGFAVAARRLPATFGALLLVGVGLAATMFPFWMLAARTPPQSSASAGLVIVLLGFLLLGLLFFLLMRLSLITPVSAVGRIGPLGILRQSWSLTKGHVARLLFSFLLIGLVFVVAAVALSFVFGSATALLVGSPESDFTAAFVFELLNSLFYAAYAVLMLCFVAAIYAQLVEEESDPA